MDGLHSAPLTGNLIAYSTALLVACLLLVLTLRAARLPGTPFANIGFAVCGVFWTGAGLAVTAGRAAGLDTFIPRAVQYTAALAVLVPVLATWQARRVAQAAAAVSAAFAVVAWSRAVPLDTLRPWVAYYTAAALVAGYALSPARKGAPQAMRIPSHTIVLAGCAAAALVSVQVGAVLFFILTHLILVAVLCGFFLFARFRYADTFVRYGVRIVLAGALAASIISTIQSHFLAEVAERAHSKATFHALAMIVVANVALLSLTFLDEIISRRLIRWLFREPDFRGESRKLAARLAGLQSEAEVAEAVEETARRSLDLAGASIGPGRGGDELVERELEVLVPIYSDGAVSHVLRAEPGPSRPALVSRDLLYLRDLATQCGNRFDALRREERQIREARLVQQVTEAELRALRAQINPHFLFNSLNTIADLTARDPARAETMTVRLAAVFRHVLAHSARPLTSVRDELEFLRAYLYIEEARFGDRLQASIEAAPGAENAAIPSLILQPLVENALKHGLGPKPGPGRLWVHAAAEGGEIVLTVEDDGIGLAPLGAPPGGVGLANVADRLRTLYRDRASATLERRDGGGCRATVRIPGREV